MGRNMEVRKKYLEANKEKIKEQKKIRYEANKEKIKEYQKNYRINNKEKINNYYKRKRSEDELYKLKGNTRNLVKNSLKGFFKNIYRTEEILGCTLEDFKLHLESKFESWMNWGNYGICNGELNYGWDIDHVIPISSAKTLDDVYRLNHYTNLQPLCSYTNRYIKRDSYT
jgi:hypothetical protein